MKQDTDPCPTCKRGRKRCPDCKRSKCLCVPLTDGNGKVVGRMIPRSPSLRVIDGGEGEGK